MPGATHSALTIRARFEAQTHFNVSQDLGELSLSDGATAAVTESPAPAVILFKIRQLAIDNQSALDVKNNALAIDYDGPAGALLDQTRQWIMRGQAFGTGIVSSSIDPGRRLGYGDTALLGVRTYAGLSVDDSSVVVLFTFSGDADLDGDVDVGDLGQLATHWQSAADWAGGDFDYNGTVDVNDLGLLATNWQAGVGTPLGASFAEAVAGFGLPNVAVPKPTGLGLMLASVALKCCRRR
jgi:hypothetical protein